MSPASRKTTIFWWAASILLHVAVIGVIAVSPTLQELLNPFSRTARAIDPPAERIEQMVRLTRQRLTDRLQTNLQTMLELEQRFLETEQQHRRRIANDHPTLLDWSVAELERRQLADIKRQESAAQDAESEPDPVDSSVEPPSFLENDTDTSPIDPDAREMMELYRRFLEAEQRINRIYERLLVSSLSGRRGVELSLLWDDNRLSFPRRDIRDEEALIARVRRLDDGRYESFREAVRQMRHQVGDVHQHVLRIFRQAEDLVALDADFDLLSWQELDWGLRPLDQAISPDRAAGMATLDPSWLRPSPGDAYIPEGLVHHGIRLGRPADGDAIQWMAVDSWYVVGPFEHPGRRRENLDRPYLPETTVDLDQQFVGKDGRLLEWRFVQLGRSGMRPQLMVVPPGRIEPWGVWYAFTEIYSPDERTVLVAFGSDDYGICWINDEVVWKSSPEVRAWTPFGSDAFAMVELRRGINRVLFKLENAGGLTGFSMLIYARPL